MSRVIQQRASIIFLALLLGMAMIANPTFTAHSLAGHSPTLHQGASRQPAARLSAMTTVLAYPPPPILAKAAFLFDLTTRQVLYAKNADARLPMASTTKITTAVLVLSHARLSDIVKVSEKAATVGESTMSLQRGERLTVLQLLYGLLLNSGNDAAVALAEDVGGSEKRFVGMMNSLARSLGMTNTHYATPHGLDALHHFTSARDLATITQYALRFPVFRQIVGTISYHIRATRHNQEHWLASVNHVMYWFPGVDGVKPGATDAAGFCQVVTAWRNGRHVLVVLLNTPTMVTDVRNLLDYGSHDFRWVQAPAWWDSPANVIHGGVGATDWLYYLGAGHYIRGIFLHSFIAHGSLRTLGYPRTEAMALNGRLVQYFQGGELRFNPLKGTIQTEALGRQAALLLAPRSVSRDSLVVHGFAGAYQQFGGRKVLGTPVTSTVRVHGITVQFFRSGAIAQIAGAPALVPVGDLALRERGWLPAVGAANAYPSTLAGAMIDTLRLRVAQ